MVTPVAPAMPRVAEGCVPGVSRPALCYLGDNSFAFLASLSHLIALPFQTVKHILN